MFNSAEPGSDLLFFLLQVMALCQAPFLMDDPHVGLLFPADAIARAKHYLAMTSGGVGKYLCFSFTFDPKSSI